MPKKKVPRSEKSRSQLTKADRAEIKKEQAAFITKFNSAVANEHQQAIFEAAKTQSGRYVVLAGPGSGKTFTSIKASFHFTGSSIYFSYNRKIKIDTNDKLIAIDSPMVASTSHSFGLGCLQAYTNGQCKVDDTEKKYPKLIDLYIIACWQMYLAEIKDEIQEQDADPGVLRLDARRWTGILIHYAMVSLAPLTDDGLRSVVEEFDLNEIKPWSLVWDFVVNAVITVIEEGKKQFLGPEHTVVYDDMIYYPNIIPMSVRQFDHVIVDEAQDTSRASLELILKACHAHTQIFFVGDKKQCQPAGTMVRSSDGIDVPIETLVPGSSVYSFDRRSAAYVKRNVVTETASRQYDGPLYTVAAGGKQSRCTDSHKWLVRWTNTDKPVWVTYLMKKGDWYRVGQAQLFNTVEGRACFGLATRARVEKADAAWILDVHDSFESAIVHEAITAAKYGLPQVVFHPVWNNAHLTQGAIDTIYGELLPLEEKAVQCLSDHGRRIEYPVYTKSSMSGYSDDRKKINSAGEQQRQGRTTFFETQACNLISGYMAIPVAPNVIVSTHDKLEWQTITVTSEPYSGLVYSLNVGQHHKYIADGLVTCNSIYAFAGAAFDSIDQIIERLHAETLPLRICYRCGSKIIDLANQLGGELIPAGQHAGNVEVIGLDYVECLQAGDAVLGRTTAKLIEGCLKTLQTGRKAKVLGRDLGASIAALVTILEAMQKDNVSQLQPDLSNLLAVLSEYQDNALKSLMEARENPEMAMAEVKDRVATVRAFFEAYISKCRDGSLRVPDDPQCTFDKTARDFKQYIKGLFIGTEENAKSFILFMTAHRAKGGEWDNVFIIGTDEFPHSLAKSDRQKEQEVNLMYVAVTRAINNLYFVNAPFSCLDISGYEPAQPLTIISVPALDHLEIHPATVAVCHDQEFEQPVGSTVVESDVRELGLQPASVQHDFEQPVTVVESVAEKLAEGKVSRISAIEVLCPACNSSCMDPRTQSSFITYDLVGHTIVCSACEKQCIVPFNAFSLSGDVVAREKPTLGVPHHLAEKKGRTKKEKKAPTGVKPKSGKEGDVRQPLQLSLNMTTIRTLNAMGVNKSELYEELLQMYEPFLKALASLPAESKETSEPEEELEVE